MVCEFKAAIKIRWLEAERAGCGSLTVNKPVSSSSWVCPSLPAFLQMDGAPYLGLTNKTCMELLGAVFQAGLASKSFSFQMSMVNFSSAF